MKGKDLKEELRGVHVIVYTPFKPDFALDEEGMREQVRYLIDHGVKRGQGVLIPTGSGGECAALTIAERKRIMEIVVDEARGEVPVVPGCNHSGTGIVIELARHAREVGADGVMVMPTYYFRPPGDETIFRHYQAISEAADIGILVYNNPTITGANMSVQLVGRLAEIENVAGVKECSPRLYKHRMEQMLYGDRIAIVSGQGPLEEPYHLMIGQPGYVAGYTNFAPEINVGIYKAAMSGDMDRAAELSHKLLPLGVCLYNLGRTAGAGQGTALLKECCRLAGRPGAIPRPPLLPATKEQSEQLETQLANLGVL